jgi:hypothetical protein
MSDLSVRAFGGRIRGRVAADFDSRAIDTIVLKASRIDMRRLYEASGYGEGSIGGQANVDLRLDRSAWNIDSLRGSGKGVLTNVTIRNMAVQQRLIIALLLPQLAEVTFKKVNGDFRIRGGRVYLEGLEAKGDPLQLAARGSVSFKGYLNQDVTGSLSSSFVKDLAPVVRNSLAIAPNGDGRFSCRIQGRVESPVIVLDKQMLDRAVKSVFEEIGKELGKYLK